MMANFDAHLDDEDIHPPRCQHAISFTRWCVDCFLLDVAIHAEDFNALPSPLCPDEVDDG